MRGWILEASIWFAGRWMLLYPRRFRADFCPAQMEMFESIARERIERAGYSGLFWLTLSASIDIARTALAERFTWLDQRRGLLMHQRNSTLFSGMLQDIRATTRGARRNWGASLAVVVTLALGLGATTAIFSVVNGVLLKPLPYPESDELVFVWDQLEMIDIPRAWVQRKELQDLREGTRAFDGFAGLGQRSVSVIADGLETRQVDAGAATSNLFSLLGVNPLLGRLFAEGDDAPGTPLVGVISNSFWRDHFGSDPEIIGRRIHVFGDSPLEIVGVLPDDFDFEIPSSLGSPQAADLWYPLQIDFEAEQRGSHNIAVLARISDGHSFEQAVADMDRVSARIDEEFYGSTGFRFSPVPVRSQIVGEIRGGLMLQLGTVVLLLTIAFANVATITLARTQARAGEFALRRALGAGGGRLFRQLLMESVLYSIAGFTVALPLAEFAPRLVATWSGVTIPRLDEVVLDARVLGFGVATALVVGLLTGLVSITQMGGGDLSNRLREGNRDSGANRSTSRLRGLFVSGQLALAVTLLGGAGVLTRTLVNLQRADLGFDRSSVLVGDLRLNQTGSNAESGAFLERLVEDVAALPGVVSAGIGSTSPMGRGASQGGALTREWDPELEFEDYPPSEAAFVDQMGVTSGYFAASGIDIVDGSDFVRTDLISEPQVIIDDLLAERFFPGESAVGRQVYTRNEMRRVVGVVRHARQWSPASDDREQIYVPMTQAGFRGVSLVVRTASDPLGIVAPVKSTIQSYDPNLPLYNIRTLEGVVDASLANRQLAQLLTSSFAATALALSAVGVFGLLAYTVGQKRKEIGIRLALGADRKRILGLIAGFISGPVGMGLITGLLVFSLSSKVLESHVWGVSPLDGWTLAITASTMVVVALAASIAPTLSALRVNPSTTLRED